MSDSPNERIPDEDDTSEAPLTMAASVVLTNLPKDASKALETAGNLKVEKSMYPSLKLFLLTSHNNNMHFFSIYLPTTLLASILCLLFMSNVCAVTVRLQPIGSAPQLNQRVFRLSANQQFVTIVRFLRKKLGILQHESVFCYVGSVFSPALDEGVGNLWTVSKACFVA